MKKQFVIISFCLYSITSYCQQFEAPHITDNKFEKVHVKVHGNFAMQFQGLNHHADSALIPLGKGINLPTANLSVDADLARGIKVNLTTYLSSRHHNDTWVKGGYLLMDKLPFIHSDAIDRAMDYLTLKIGVMEINYGDQHFRRSDNGNITNNPFVGNYIMDGYTTAPAFEALFRDKGYILMGGLTTGSLKPSIAGYSASTDTYSANNSLQNLAMYGKLGFDKNLNDSWRLRLTLSGYHCKKNSLGTIYYGDRTGSRFYLVMNKQTGSPDDVDPSVNFTSGRWGPGLTNKDNSLMVNLFTKYNGLELFGTVESARGTSLGTDKDFNFSQYAADGLYRFGRNKQFYGGLRYNLVDGGSDMSVNRVEVSAGWYLLKSTLLKLEYVNQQYKNFATYGNKAGFNGIIAEAGISF